MCNSPCCKCTCTSAACRDICQEVARQERSLVNRLTVVQHMHSEQSLKTHTAVLPEVPAAIRTLQALCLHMLVAGHIMRCIQIKDYGDLSYLLEAEYERQLVALSQDAEMRSPPMGTRGLTKGKVSLFLLVWGDSGWGLEGGIFRSNVCCGFPLLHSSCCSFCPVIRFQHLGMDYR